MNNLFAILIIPFFLYLKFEECPPRINQLPMYGMRKKCQEQIRADKEFLASCDSSFRSRKDASVYYMERGWKHFSRNTLDSATIRFNQAWLLDSLNADVYWGFGNVLGKRSDYAGSIRFFEKSVRLKSDNAKVWESFSTSYGQLYSQTRDKRYLNKAIDCLKKSLKLNPKNAQALGQLTGAYTYFAQKDSALKYLRMTDAIDPRMVNPEVRKVLRDQ